MRTKKANMVNLLDMARQADHSPPLELIRLGADELPVIPFVQEATATKVHFCGEDEIRGYVRCNEPDCVLCNIGRKQDERLLLPVYQPTLKAIGILPISPSMRPFAFLPQLLEVLQQEGERQVVFIRREGMTKFTVTTSPVLEGADAGEAKIKEFLAKMGSGAIDLASVYNWLSNKQLVAVPTIAETLRLKGINPDDVN